MTPEGAPSEGESPAAENGTSENVTETAGGGPAGVERPDLGPNVVLLEWDSPRACGGKAQVYVLGTAHVSQESCTEVRTLIQHVKPDVVFVELCRDRAAMLTRPEQLPEPQLADLVTAWRRRQGNTFNIAYSWFLAKVAHKLQVPPGEEFRVAYEEAQKCGALVQLGDRPVQVTLRRTWSRLSSWQRCKLVSSLLWGALFLPDTDELSELMEDLKNADLLEVAVKELGRAFPSLVETLVRERDLYMTATLRQVARRSRTVVAVVGRGHQAGIRSNWEAEAIDVQSLLVMPVDPPPLLSPATKRWLLIGFAVSSVGLLVYMRVARAKSF